MKRNGYSELLTQFGCDVQIGATTTSLSERLGNLHARHREQLAYARGLLYFGITLVHYNTIISTNNAAWTIFFFRVYIL
jgi:hypothetical protein